MIHYLMTIEITMNKKEPNILTKNLTNYQYRKSYKKPDVNDDVMMDYDATSLYPSAMRDENSVYPKIEIGFAHKAYMNKTYVEAFNNETFNQDGNESAIITKK